MTKREWTYEQIKAKIASVFKTVVAWVSWKEHIDMDLAHEIVTPACNRILNAARRGTAYAIMKYRHYLGKAAKRELIKYRDKQRKQKVKPATWVYEDPERWIDPPTAGLDFVLRKLHEEELKRQVWLEIEKLPYRQGECVRMRCHKHSFAEIAWRQGITEAGARSSYRQGIEALRKIFCRQYDFEMHKTPLKRINRVQGELA